MVYKTLKKVSNVCQLLDKSKYPGVITNAGVTTTSNGDGSITINGTSTKSTYINCTPAYPKENNGHVFYICANNTTMSKSTWKYGLLNQVGLLDYGAGVIAKTNDRMLRATGITFNNGIVFDNVIIKPQIIDLTEMYGAGNEPTTVEEFRTKFPNELYDYKPYCFVKSYKTLLKATDDKIITSYKKSLVCKTKNLFNINTTPTFNNTKATYVVEGTKVTFKSNNTANNSFFYSIPTTVGKTYTVSVNSIDWDSTSLGIFLSSAKIEDKLDYGLINKTILTKTFVAVSNTLWIHGYLSYQAGDFTFTFDKLQVELGDTATDYVPYGHL